MLGFMGATVVGIIRIRNLFSVVILTGVFSLLAAAIYVVMDAVDVAFTEAAVGAGVSTVLMLGTLALTSSEEKTTGQNRSVPAAVIVVITGAILIYGTLDMPTYGDANAPINRHVVPRYINDSAKEIGLPNVVTSVLASYRGYDTLGETFVIFTAAMGVLAIIGRGRRKRKKPKETQGADA